MADKGARLTRRDEYAEATRQAIIDAGRKLFGEQGFFGTKVEDIAALARVSPATVYAVAGGKQGLLRTLIEMGTSGPIMCTTLQDIQAASDAATVLRLTARVMRDLHDRAGDIIRVIAQTAPHDEAAAQTWDIAKQRCREALAVPAERLAALDALKSGVGAGAAVDILWFYFGIGGVDSLVQQNGWSRERAEQWLVEQATFALLG